MRLSQILQEKFILYQSGDEPYTDAFFKGCTSVEKMQERFNLDEQKASAALAQAQTYYRHQALEYFNEVQELAAGEESGAFPWPFNVWLPVVSECVHHLLVVGETGSGKSYLAKAILCVRSWRGQVVVLDPHAVQPSETGLGDWGVMAVGAGRKYPEINRYMTELIEEMGRRYEERSAGIQSFEYLNIFIDEWPSIKTNCSEASKFMKTIAREGRKVGMRLVILTQSPQVESLGLRGESDTKENFSIIFLGKYAARHMPAAYRYEERCGYLQYQDKGYPISTEYLNFILDPFFDMTRLRVVPPVWQIPNRKDC